MHPLKGNGTIRERTKLGKEIKLQSTQSQMWYQYDNESNNKRRKTSAWKT
jgi:hypothetical protein